MTYTTKKCPFCGKAYEHYSAATKHYHNHSGSPFLKCSNCGKTFVDKDIEEPALSPFNDFEYSILSCFLAFLFPWGFAAFILTGCAISPETSSIFTIIAAIVMDAIYILLMFFSIKKRHIIKEEAKIEYEESKKRLQNLNYAIALKKAGFDVPYEYLPTEEEIELAIETIKAKLAAKEITEIKAEIETIEAKLETIKERIGTEKFTEIEAKIEAIKEAETKAIEEAEIVFNQTYTRGKNDIFLAEIRSLSPGEWRCHVCGRINQEYVGTCACGEKKQRKI